jgi:hypothetical protein
MCLVWTGLLIAPASTVRAETVVCDAATISVNAADMKAEDLIKAVGTSCGIRMVLRGELFTEDVFSLQFENMPVRAGLDRVLRTLKIPNHMLNFAGTGPHRRVVEILLVGKGGGERELTPAASTAVPEIKSAPKKPAQAPPQTGKPPEEGSEKTPEEEAADDERQEKFMDLLDKVIDEHFENEDDINPEQVLEMYRQALPEDMRNNIPAEVLEEVELLGED